MCRFLRIYFGTKSITAFPASWAFSDGLFYPKALVIWRAHIWCILTIWRLGLRINSVYGTRPLTWVDKTGRILAFTCNPTPAPHLLTIFANPLVQVQSVIVVTFCKDWACDFGLIVLLLCAFIHSFQCFLDNAV